MIGKFGRSLRQQWIGALALFLVLGGGTAWALSNNSVKSRHIDNGQVKTEDLAGNAVTGGKIDPDAVKASDIDDGTLGTADSDILPHGRITTSTGAQVFNDNVIETRFLDRIEFSRGVGFNFAADASEIVIETPGVYLVIGEVVWQSNSFGHRETMLSKNSDTVFFAENAVRPAQAAPDETAMRGDRAVRGRRHGRAPRGSDLWRECDQRRWIAQRSLAGARDPLVAANCSASDEKRTTRPKAALRSGRDRPR